MTLFRIYSMLVIACLFWITVVLAPESAMAGCSALDRPDPPTALSLTRVFPDLSFSAPVSLRQAPGETGRWYVTEQTGRIKVFDEGDAAARVLADLSDNITYGGERGLLDMAFHPGFPSPPFVYVSYTNKNGDSVLSRLTAAVEGYTTYAGSEEILITVAQPFANHNGGQIAFGPDGKLYWSLGDGGSGGDPLNNGQNTHTLLGSILRIDVDGGTPYAVPADNPFAGSPCGQGGGCPEIYAWGLRNPWRFSFDIGGGHQLFAGDVGQKTWEEIDIIEKGKNYGWHCYEGTHEFDLADCNDVYANPIHEYEHINGRCSITGGYVYRGGALPGLNGHYLFADYCTGEIWGLTGGAGNWSATLLADSTIRLAAFGQGNNGEIYALDLAGGGIYQLTTSQDTGQGFPNLLSDTGYFEAGAPTTPVACFIPYAVNAPLWSDGAAKRRFVWAPQGTVHIEPDGDFTFPAGTVFIKEFRLNGVPVETRLFMRHDEGEWAGYSYNWRADGTDAELLTDSASEIIDGQEWHFPGPNECLNCHTAAAGRALGPEIGQLNADHDYGSNTGQVNQLAYWENKGLFDAPLPAPPAKLPAFARPDDPDAAVSRRSRAYLHSNCANCHRPGGLARGRIDFRHETGMPDMNICGVAPTLGDLGLPRARLMAPGTPERSVILERMKIRDENQMPPLASNIPDPLGISVVGTWIMKTRSCNPAIAPQMLLLLGE